MNYGKYADYALPDKVLFTFNTKDYKLPRESLLIMMMAAKRKRRIISTQ